MPTTRRLLAVLAFASFLGLTAGPAAAAASTLYVEHGGSDAHPCSQAEPCATIAHAVSVAAGGDTISVGPGTYKEEGLNALHLTSSLRIEGAPGAGETVVQGSAGASALDISATGRATLSHLTIQDHESGGVGVKDEGGAVTVSQSTVSDSNVAGIEAKGGSVTIADSTLAHDGVGAVMSETTTTITDSTVAGNVETGVYSFGGATSVIDSTISGNALYGVQSEGGVATTLAGDILEANKAGDCFGTAAATDAGYNLASDGACHLSAPTSVSGSNAISLGPLAQNGGPTETEITALASAAVHKIPAAATATIAGKAVALCEGTSDQRGVSRPQPSGGKCDIGAVELAPSTTTLSASPASASAGQPVTLTAKVKSALGAPPLPAPTGFVHFGLKGGALISGCEFVALKTVAGVQQAQCTTTTLPAGSDSLYAYYGELEAEELFEGEMNGYLPSEGSTTYAVAQSSPATLYVKTPANGGSDTNPCTEAEPCATIAHAVSIAAGGDTVSVGPGAFKEDVVIDRALILEGASGGSASTVEGSGEHSTAITVDANVKATLAHMIVKNASGYGVENRGGATALAHDTVSASGDAVFSFGGATSIANSTISHSEFGVYGEPGVTTSISESTISENSQAGVQSNGGTTTISDSTISGNKSGVDVGTVASMKISDSTIAGNREGVYNDGTTSLIDSTVADNLPGGGVVNEAALTLAGTIVAENDEGGIGHDCVGAKAVVDAGYNIDGDGSCGLKAVGSVPHTFPELGGLQQNGGPTETLMPRGKEGLPELDAIPIGATATVGAETVKLCEGTDQRGVPRPQPAGGKCDIGAVELAASTTTLSVSPFPTEAGEEVTLTATVTSAVVSPTLPAPTGVVSFALVGGRQISGCTARPVETVKGAQQATCKTTALPAGADLLSAHYGEDESNGFKESEGQASEVVSQPPAATLYVKTPASGGSDANPCTTEAKACATISHAVSIAAGGDTISVGPGTFNEEVVIDRALRIEGASGASATIVHGSGKTFSNAIFVEPNVRAALSHLTVEDEGVETEAVRVEGSPATTITASTLTASAFGVANDHGATTVSNSTIAGNERGVLTEDGATTVADSTISNNSVSGVEGAYGASTTISDSTVAGNADTGIVTRDSVHGGSRTTTIIADSTISGAKHGVESEPETATALAGSIVTGATEGDCSGAVSDGGYNLASDTTCFLSSSTSSSKFSSSELGPLGPNGGPTETMLPVLGGLAVERIPANASATIAGKGVALCEGTSDQRGDPRPQPSGGACDIGAVELAGSATTLSASPASPTPGQAVTLTATVAAVPGAPALAAPAGSVSFASGGVSICPSVALAAVGGSQQATCTTAALPVGASSFSAAYEPSDAYHRSIAALTVTTAGSGGGGSGGGGSGGSSATGGVAGMRSSVLAVTLSALHVSPVAFAAAQEGPSASKVGALRGRSSHAKTPKTGATVSFTLNQAGRVLFTFTQAVAGRIARGGHCVKQTRANARARRCTRTVSLGGGFGWVATEGLNRFHLSGRLSGRTLRPGRYTLVAIASAGGRSASPQRIALSVVR